MLAMSLKFHILKCGTLMLYRTELVSHNVQEIVKISDFGILGQCLKGVSRPRVWFVGLISTTKVTLLAYSFK